VEASGPFDEATVGRDMLLTVLRGRAQAKPHLSLGRKREIKTGFLGCRFESAQQAERKKIIA
jgi:hypothetical protein